MLQRLPPGYDPVLAERVIRWYALWYLRLKAPGKILLGAIVAFFAYKIVSRLLYKSGVVGAGTSDVKDEAPSVIGLTYEEIENRQRELNEARKRLVEAGLKD